MGIRGVWSLENVEIKKPQDDWVEIPNVFVIGEEAMQRLGISKDI